ncbi:DUF6223 family protein [Nocardia sp. NPDC051321]|uniref:DUF6223 family protein n=1 Tax=Nocardia sp. NPDC051321 TaxID=3364323 RepID=UPI0037AC5C27
MSVRYLPAVTAAVLLAGVAVAAPVAAEVQLSAATAGLTSGRVGPSVTALFGLIGVAVGSRALNRVGRGAGNVRKQAASALVAGLMSLALGSWFAATAEGGPGTGNGIVGAWAAMLFGLVVGVVPLNRSRRGARPCRRTNG